MEYLIAAAELVIRWYQVATIVYKKDAWAKRKMTLVAIVIKPRMILTWVTFLNFTSLTIFLY
jgi:hypothetical protein